MGLRADMDMPESSNMFHYTYTYTQAACGPKHIHRQDGVNTTLQGVNVRFVIEPTPDFQRRIDIVAPQAGSTVLTTFEKSTTSLDQFQEEDTYRKSPPRCSRPPSPQLDNAGKQTSHEVNQRYLWHELSSRRNAVDVVQNKFI